MRIVHLLFTAELVAGLMLQANIVPKLVAIVNDRKHLPTTWQAARCILQLSSNSTYFLIPLLAFFSSLLCTFIAFCCSSSLLFHHSSLQTLNEPAWIHTIDHFSKFLL